MRKRWWKRTTVLGQESRRKGARGRPRDSAQRSRDKMEKHLRKEVEMVKEIMIKQGRGREGGRRQTRKKEI